MSRAPIMSGTRKFAKPARTGTTTRKTIVVPCIVNSSLYVARDETLVRLRELRAHQQGHQPAGDEEDGGRGDVEDPDPLVVDGDEPARHAAARPGGDAGAQL